MSNPKWPFLVKAWSAKNVGVHLALGAVITGIILFAINGPARAERRRKADSAYMSHRTGA